MGESAGDGDPAVEGVTGFVGTLEDRTARTEHALSLERSREFVREVLASIPQPMFVKDASHRWLMVNDAFAKLVGRRSENWWEPPMRTSSRPTG